MPADVKLIKEHYNALDRHIVNFRPHYRLIGEMVRSRKQNFSGGAFLTPEAGAFLNEEIFDSTAPLAVDTSAAALLGLMWPHGGKTMYLEAIGEDMEEDEEVAEYFEWASERVAAAMDDPRAGLATTLAEYMVDQLTFGTSGVSVFQGQDIPLAFQCWDVQEIVFGEGVDGFIDTVMRKYQWTVKQCVDRWGINKVSKKTADLYNNNKLEDSVTLLHVLRPRRLRNIKAQDAKNMPMESVHIEFDGDHIIDEGGFHEMPVIMSRFDKRTGEVPGRSPTMRALPDIMLANTIKEGIILAIEKNLDPPLVVLSDGSYGPGQIDTSAKGINVIASSGRISNQMPIQPLFTVGKIEDAVNLLAQLTENIKQHYFIDKLLDLNNEVQMTAREAVIRNSLRNSTLRNVVSRQVTEFFNRLVIRSFNMMFRNDQLGVVPGSVAHLDAQEAGIEVRLIPEKLLRASVTGERAFEVRYKSPAMRDMQAEEVEGIFGLLEMAGSLVGINPEIMDNIDQDAALRLVGEQRGVPNEIMRKRDDIAMIRQGRMEAQKAQSMLQTGRQVAEIDKVTADATAQRKAA